MKTNCSFHKHKLPSGPEMLVGVFISHLWDLQTVRKILGKVKMGNFGTAPPSFCSNPSRLL